MGCGQRCRCVISSAFYPSTIHRMRLRLLFCLLFAAATLSAQPIHERHLHNQTPTYDEVLSFYQEVAATYPEAQLKEYGQTDCGEPLHLLVIDPAARFNAADARKNKAVVFVNNAIHPGEPCGVDASILLIRELLMGKKKALNPNVVLCIVPMYNIGGALNRGCCSRANQNGPEMHGFRGNARNLDLNRDFTKLDSKNARAFAKMYQEWMPDIFIDTHTSNGADYQHVMTVLSTQPDKLGAPYAAYMRNTILPAIYGHMENAGYPACPYVDVVDRTPENGLQAFYDSPRYSSGYAALFGGIGFVTEAHMLKPYKDRVLATHAFLTGAISLAGKEATNLKLHRAAFNKHAANNRSWPLSWKLDTTRSSLVPFKGYAAKYKPSEVTGKDRLWYDRTEPWEREIPFFEFMLPDLEATLPTAYIFPQAWSEVADKLTLNGVEVKQLTSNAQLEVGVRYLENVDTGTSPYEGHYLHKSVQVRAEQMTLDFRAGDYVVITNQPGARFIAATLEPQATDSYFAWNHFDAVLQQKEWFSPYVFEDQAAEILKEQPELRAMLDEQMKDEAFANNPWAPLAFVYRHSNMYEATHNRYPVVSIESVDDLPME